MLGENKWEVSAAPAGAAVFAAVLGGDIKRAEHKLAKLCRSAGFEGLQASSGKKIALRRTEGPVDGCIALHHDGDYAITTAQYTLNSDTEYKGGELCFVEVGADLKKSICVPRRPAGTLTVHHRAVFHGVTRLYEGVRYSLFLVDRANGLGDKDVHVVGLELAKELLAKVDARMKRKRTAAAAAANTATTP